MHTTPFFSSCTRPIHPPSSGRRTTDDRGFPSLQATLFAGRGFEMRLRVRDDGEGGAVGRESGEMAGDGDFEGFEG